MPRQKKSDIEILVDIIEGGKLAITDYQWIEKIVARKVKNRQMRQGEGPFEMRRVNIGLQQGEAKDASKEREAAKDDGSGPVPSSSRPKNPDGDVNPSASGLRKKGEVNKKEKE